MGGTSRQRWTLRPLLMRALPMFQRVRAYFAVKGLRYWLIAAVIVGSSVVLTPFAERVVDLRYLFFRIVTELDPRVPSPSQTRIVYIDDSEHRRLNSRVPLDRNYLADIVRKLDFYNVRVIALDFIFSAVDFNHEATVGDFAPIGAFRKETDNLAGAIAQVAQNRKIILGKMVWADSVGPDQTITSLLDVYQPYGICVHPNEDGSWYNPGIKAQPGSPGYPLKGDAAANIRCGYINLPADMRQFPSRIVVGKDNRNMDSFAIAIARSIQADLPLDITDDTHYSGYLLQRAFDDPKIVTSKQLLGPYSGDLKSLLEHQIVIVGPHWKIGPGPADFGDMHESPAGPISGSLIHQNFVEALLDHRLYNSVAAKVIEFLLGIASAIVFSEVTNVWSKAGLLTLGVVGLLVIQLIVFFQFYLFFDASVVVLGLGLHSIIERLFEPRHEHHDPAAPPPKTPQIETVA